MFIHYSSAHHLSMIFVMKFKCQWQKRKIDDTENNTETSWTRFLQSTWSQHFSDMVSESAANQPSILHKYHWSTLWASPSSLQPIMKVKLPITWASRKIIMAVKGFKFSVNNNLNSGFLSKTIESARKMDMSSVNSFRTLSVCIKQGQSLEGMLMITISTIKHKKFQSKKHQAHEYLLSLMKIQCIR